MEEGIQFISFTIVLFIRYFLLSGVAFLIFYKLFTSAFQQAKIQDKNATKKDFLREIFYSMQTNLVLIVIALIFLFSPLKEYSNIYTDINAFPTWYLPLTVVLALLIHDTYFYWLHRFLHIPKVYKKAHNIHHLSTNPSPWLSLSFNFAEAIAEGMIIPILIFTLPMHPLALIIFATSSLMINTYGHLGYEIMPKWFRHSFLFQIFNTSVHHNLHHSKFECNYGLYFRFWDRLMNTENPDYVQEYDKVQERRFG